MTLLPSPLAALGGIPLPSLRLRRAAWTEARRVRALDRRLARSVRRFCRGG